MPQSNEFSFTYQIGSGYGLFKAQALITIDLWNQGKIIAVSMNPTCFEGVTNRHSLLMEFEAAAEKIYSKLSKADELIDRCHTHNSNS